MFNWFRNITKELNPTLTHEEVRAILKEALGSILNPQGLIILSDKGYTTIDAQSVSKVFSRSKLSSVSYRPEVHDCEDYAMTMLVEINNFGYNNWKLKYGYAFGIVYGDFPTPHAINWFITPEKEVLFIEPQSGEIFKPTGNNIVFIYT